MTAIAPIAKTVQEGSELPEQDRELIWVYQMVIPQDGSPPLPVGHYWASGIKWIMFREPIPSSVYKQGLATFNVYAEPSTLMNPGVLDRRRRIGVIRQALFR